MKRTIVIGFLAVSSAYLLAGAAAADTAAQTSTSTQASVPARQTLISSFSGFAGSEENAASLVNGLRSGSLVTLAPATTGSNSGADASISFMPPTRPMGWGNVRHALTLAQRELAAQGITDPTPAELQAALTGGSITTATGDAVTLSGTLSLRSQGMGWGQIAKTTGVPLGNAASIHASGNASGNASGTAMARGQRVGAVTTASGEVLRPAYSNGGSRVQARIDSPGTKSARSGGDPVLPAAASSGFAATSGLGLRAAGAIGGSGHANGGNGGQGRGR